MTARVRQLIEPRGLDRVQAASYIGVSASKFDQMIDDGRMPQPRRIDTRKVWDRLALDDAFELLPCDEPENPLDKIFLSKAS